MKRVRSTLLALIFLAAFSAPCLAQKADAANCKDHPLLTRLPDYWIESCVEKQFDAYKFMAAQGKTNQVEGQYWNIRYQPPVGLTTKPSTLQVLRNVANAVTQIGGTLVATDSSKETLRLSKDSKELWIEVWADYTGKYILTIVEKAAMSQEIKASADAFANGLKATGHISVDGIYFDTGKSELKPESQPAIDEVVKLLKADRALKLFVVGHTDTVGPLDANIKLSQDRSQAVVQALVANGIEAARLKAHGNGPFAPVTSNDNETGRATNRRVELVKQ
jgi:outer membrane protein OmpA-like peptidoglycan-associated protein